MSIAARQLSGVVAAVATVARRDPDHVAVIDSYRSVTYAELWVEVEDVAERLVRAGLRLGDRIALVAEGSADYLTTALGVWRAGGVLVTVYPSSGPGELEYAIRRSDPSLVIVGAGIDRDTVSRAAPGTPVASLDLHDLDRLRTDATGNPEGLRAPLHMICFSSGTTSTPKAIMLSEVGVYNTAATYAEVWHLGPDDRGVVSLPLAWLYGLASTALALLVGGGTVVLLRRGHPAALHEAIRDQRATFLAGVTATFAKLVRHAEEHGLPSDDFASLRLCISGGEPRNEALFARWKGFTGTAVLDAYCASECLPLVTYDPTVDPEPVIGSAGKVVPRSQLKVVGPDGDQVAPGEVGEGLSTGLGLMLGYWRDEAQTRAVITDDGWYRTKDLVRIDEDGFVYVVGRLSDVIIRGGTNISPTEVEHVLSQHPDVAEVVVVGLPDEVYGERLAAAVVSHSGDAVPAEELDHLARGHLSAYKVPSTFVTVEDLPRNSTTGKIDRRGLVEQLTGRAV